MLIRHCQLLFFLPTKNGEQGADCKHYILSWLGMTGNPQIKNNNNKIGFINKTEPPGYFSNYSQLILSIWSLAIFLYEQWQ